MSLYQLTIMQDPDFRKALDGHIKELRKQKRWSQKVLGKEQSFVA